MKAIVFHPDADVEITEAAQYYEVRKAGLGSDLLGEVERALDQILMSPEASGRIGRRVRKKLLWAVPLQSNLRCLSGPHSYRSVRSPETAAFLLAKSDKGQGREGRPDQSLNLTGNSTGKSASRYAFSLNESTRREVGWAVSYAQRHL